MDLALSMYSVKRIYPLLPCCPCLGFFIMLGLGKADHRQDCIVLLQVTEAGAELYCR